MNRRNAVAQTTSADSAWPAWARRQLELAVAVADDHRARRRPTTLAGELYHEWFTPPIVDVAPELFRRPLAGVYRHAHAGSARRVEDAELPTIERRDAIGRDRWWRTWAAQWTPSRGRVTAPRLLFSPHLGALADFVRAATSTLLDVDEPWLLACPTLPTRLRHSGSAVVYLPDDAHLRERLISALDPYLRDDTPPLCLPLSRGVALAEHPGNGMTFGEHRCHLVALAVEQCEPTTPPLRAIADVFGAHGISPAEPHRGNALG